MRSESHRRGCVLALPFALSCRSKDIQQRSKRLLNKTAHFRVIATLLDSYLKLHPKPLKNKALRRVYQFNLAVSLFLSYQVKEKHLPIDLNCGSIQPQKTPQLRQNKFTKRRKLISVTIYPGRRFELSGMRVLIV